MMSDFQWSMSFSRAEVVLINSWMPVQQIAYHMRRVFINTGLLTGSADTLSNYHIKTDVMGLRTEIKKLVD